MTRVLIVEDNEMNYDMLARWLTRRGYEVHVAVDGQQGVDRALELDPAIILMDLSLPVLDGCSATRALRALDKTRSTIIIALTAHALSGYREEALAAGCDDFVPKPVELKSLLQLMEKLLERQRQANAGEAG